MATVTLRVVPPTSPNVSQAYAVSQAAALAAFSAAIHAGAPAAQASGMATQAYNMVLPKAVAAGASTAPGSNAQPLPPAAVQVAATPVTVDTSSNTVTHGTSTVQAAATSPLGKVLFSAPVVGDVTVAKAGLAAVAIGVLAKLAGKKRRVMP